MFRELKENISYVKTLIILGILFVGVMLGSVFFSDILLPVSAALLTLFFLFDKSKFKWLSLSITAVLLISLSLVSLANAVFVVCIFLCAWILMYGYIKGLNKAELSLYLTVLYALCTVAGLFFIGAKAIGSFDARAVIQYYRELFDSFVELLISNLRDGMQLNPELAAEEEELLEIFAESMRGISNLFLAFIAIVSFFYSGVQIKIFSFFAMRLEQSPRPRRVWHFALTNVFAYFYVALVLFASFASTQNAIGIAMANLYYIFMFVFAYVGFNYVFAISTRAKRPALVRVLLFVLLLTANMLAVQILSFVGVFITTMHNKFLKMHQDTPDNFQQ